MIVPYGHERSVRSRPWATIVIFGLCLVVFLVTDGPIGRSDEEARRLFAEIGERFRENPDLELDPATQERLLQALGVDENQRAVFLETLRDEAAARSRRSDPGEQEELDALVARYWEAYRGSLAYRFGVVPDRLSGLSLLTYQFLHGGWLHLLGNLLFLYLAAPLVEERWGSGLFAAFYLLAGAVSALFWVARYPELEVPLVGASGAIAGVMGAFLVCFGASKIKFFYWFGLIWGTFEAPAWLMLPLWLVTEVLSGRAMDVAYQGQGGGGVAHWAHVWGFIAGAAFAAVVSRLGVGGSRSETAVNGDLEGRIEAALLVGRAGRVDEGLAALRAVGAASPDDDRAPGALWSLALETGRVAEGVPVMLGLIRRAARRRDDEAVLDRWRHLAAAAPQVTLEPVLAMRIAEVAQRRHDEEVVAEVLERVEIGDPTAIPAPVLERLGRLATECGDRLIGTQLAAAVRGDDRLPDDLRRALAAPAKADPPGTGEERTAHRSPATAGPAVRLRPAERLRVADGVPKALDESALTVFLERGRGRVPLASVLGVAVAAIREDGRRPYLVVDLLLDPPWDGSGELRVVRLRSTAFDPRRLVGGENAMAAFQRLLETVLERSGAEPLPDEASVRHPGTRSFPSIEAYQQEVLGVMG
ncbi:MAG TPA: rhomboid family intramembrane serine protease [Candidatus Sulfomarinibacteraceae bacterium]|nr:rhomboid family intramembrane serine protease [Candidatus Sulfomarinibacteraceae bacterium]